MIHKLTNISLKVDRLDAMRRLKEDFKLGTATAHFLVNKIISENHIDMIELYEWAKKTKVADYGRLTEEHVWRQYFTGDLLSDIRGNNLPLNPDELRKQEEEKRILDEKIAKATEWLDGLTPEAKDHIHVLTSNFIICWGPARG